VAAAVREAGGKPAATDYIISVRKMKKWHSQFSPARVKAHIR